MASSSFKLQVVFQSKAKDGIECGPETILLSNADIKQLKVKSGSYVTVQLQHTSLLCRVWPSKKSSQGVATLNKLWTPNLSVDHRNVVVTNGSIDSAIVVVCRKAVMTVYGEVGEEVSGAVGMADYVKNTLNSVLLVTGMLIGLTIRGQHFIIEVSELLGDEDQKSDGLKASLRFTLDPSTSVFFRAASSCQQATSKDNSAVTNVASATVDEIPFAGYEEQRQLAAGLLKLGLGAIDPVRPVNNSLVAQQLFRPPKGLLLFGPPGTGKTSLMYSLVRNAGCACVEISHSILVGSFQGEAEQQLRAVFEEASRRAPCCILVDNMDLLCCQRSKTGVSDLQKRIVSCMLSLIDGLASGGDGLRPVFIIGTTTKPGDIDPAIRRSGRIDREIELGVPSASQRESIFRALLQDASVVVTENGVRPENDKTFHTSSELVRDIARLAHGMVGADLLLVLKEAFFIATRRRFNAQQNPATQSMADVASAVCADSMSVNLAMEFDSLTLEGEDDFEPVASNGVEDASTSCTAPETTTTAHPLVDFNLLTDQDFREALSRVSPSALREVVVEVPTVHWGDIGGMASVKQALREVVEWPVQQPGLFSSLGISPPKGVLLYGPPGCSKTLMAKALATESSMNFLAVRGPELLSKWLGESEKAIQTLFRRARAAAPAIVFFDEIDALAGKRGDSSSGVSDRVLAQLLTELDGVQGLKQVIVLAATNRPDMLDAALIRPGRIDRKIYVPPPDALSREQILRIELRKMPVQEPVDVAGLVASTEGFSGAEMVAVCSEAAMLAVEEGALLLTELHLREALRGITPQITVKMLEFYESFAAKV